MSVEHTCFEPHLFKDSWGTQCSSFTCDLVAFIHKAHWGTQCFFCSCYRLAQPRLPLWPASVLSLYPGVLWVAVDNMNCNPHDTIEQHAIELVSSLGKEHLFVANCPSDIDSNRYSGTVITYEEAFDHSDTGVGLCLLLPKAYVLQKFIDICLNKDISVHFVFTCSNSTSEFEASAWLYNLLNDKVQHVGFMQNLGVTFCSANNQEKYLIACQVEPYAEHCHVSWSRPCRTLEHVFPRTVVERHQTISELQNLSAVNYIDFRRPNGCHRISDKIDVTSLMPMIAWQTLSLLRKSFSPLLMPLGRMDLQSVRLSISFHGMTQSSKSIFHMASPCQYWI